MVTGQSRRQRIFEKILELLADLWLVVLLLAVLLVTLFLLRVYIQPGTVMGNTFYYLLLTAPVWLTVFLGYLFWQVWLLYIKTLSVATQKSILLEIKLPREVSRSPLAMELFFTALYQTGATTFLDQYWAGKIRPWFSCELVSIGGEVKFLVWMSQDKMRDVIEAQLYAQYPDIEIHQVEDYAHEVNWDPGVWGMWGTYFKLKEADPYPIKTYVDYGLDKPAEEEEKVDPMTSMIEYLGNVGPNERVWIQILIQAHKKEGLQDGRLFEKSDWKKEAEKEIDKIRKEAVVQIDDNKGGKMGVVNPTESQKLKMAAVERSISKLPFETMIRAFYIAKKDSFNGGNITGLIGSVRQYNSMELNSFKLGWYTDHGDFGKDLLTAFGWMPWLERYMNHQRGQMEIAMLDAYKQRSFFQPPYKHFRAKPYILNTEELATIFHLPGRVLTTPTIKRIESKRAEPPVNLPL